MQCVHRWTIFDCTLFSYMWNTIQRNETESFLRDYDSAYNVMITISTTNNTNVKGCKTICITCRHIASSFRFLVYLNSNAHPLPPTSIANTLKSYRCISIELVVVLYLYGLIVTVSIVIDCSISLGMQRSIILPCPPSCTFTAVVHLLCSVTHRMHVNDW
ncbi:hypothetical protein TNIN_265471 [Trichonephila inaurata madagascariensis]|uniref:Uncharacterized protein n=1 Tax=Trichonephila inaurata madagascariensis TaxID=2747483 RepID=A0A8X6YN18_9ARAC|nr:hypothetical protein TNIN_265471 [Trichonephila inaurata madagascariensis]